MRVFVDTNVILDYVLQREHFLEASDNSRRKSVYHQFFCVICGICVPFHLILFQIFLRF